MCGPAMPWDWFTLDVAYVLTLVGGGLILRARVAMPLTWIGFGFLAICVGGFLGVETWQAQAIAAETTRGGAMAVIAAACS